MRHLGAFVGAVLGLAVASCGASLDQSGDQQLLGEAELALSVVPTGVGCLQVVATGSTTVTQLIALTSGSLSGAISLGRLPLGNVAFAATAYDVACASIGSTAPSWVADPTSATLKPGVPVTVTLNLRMNNPTTANANFVANVAEIVASPSAMILRMADGTLRTSGTPAQITNSTTFQATMTAPTGVKSVAANADGICYITSSAGVNCFGYNSYAELGPGIPQYTMQYTPTAVPFSGSVSSLAMSNMTTCATATAGVTIFANCWGYNWYGTVGLPTQGTYPSPQTIISAARVTSGMYHNCAIYPTGDTACWGYNGTGQVGDGTTTNRMGPGIVSGLRATVSLGLGDSHSCAIAADGTVRCWGNNVSGQLGDGTTTQRLTPTIVPSIADATQIVAGAASTCVRRQNGTASCWGSNQNGQLGDGSGRDQLSPVTVSGLTNVAQLAMNGRSVCALLDDQRIFCWGSNDYGQLGDGTFLPHPRPVQATVQ